MELDTLILDDLLAGVLPAGQKINISNLKQRYQVGLAPLREALARLVATGLLLCTPNKGFHTAPMSTEELCDLYDACLSVESLALSQAMKKGGEQWEEEIVSALYRLEKLEGGMESPSFEDWSQANTRFHDSLVASSSPVAKELRNSLSLKMGRYVRVAFANCSGELLVHHAVHRALAEAVLARSEVEALRLLAEHIKSGKEAFIQGFSEQEVK